METTIDRSGSYNVIDNDVCKANVYLDFHNSRVKLLDYCGQIESIILKLKKMAVSNDLGKIICTVYVKDSNAFLSQGFKAEGQIDGYFKGETACCVSYFNHHERSISNFISKEDEIIMQSVQFKDKFIPANGSDIIPRTAGHEDAKKIAGVFGKVFDTYPTPVEDPDYIKKMIDSDVLFKVIEVNGRIVSVASADMNKGFLNAEITDCATLKDFRGKGFLSELIYSLELDLRSMGFITAFSLSRARSHGINFALSKHGYEYAGRQINNCNIMGRFEDMNLWVKRLDIQ